MASHSAILSIKILTDASQAQAGMGQAASRMDKFGASAKRAMVPATAAGAAVALFGKQAVDAASRTQQAMGAVDTVFGKSSGTVKQWAADAAQAVGLSSAEYGELASKLGASLKNMGVPMDQLAGQTNDLVKLGADLSATYGGTTAEAVDALGSALRGETDPIERYGISIKQATIEAEMAKQGLDKLEGQAATAAKTQTLLGLVTEQSGKAVGAFGREADTAAGQQQRATAEWENAKSAIGTALLPLLTSLASTFGGLAKLMGENAGAVRILMGVILGLVAAVYAVNAALAIYNATTKLIAAATKAWAAVQWLLNAAMAANPILLVVIAIVALVAIMVLAYKKSDTFRRIVQSAWQGVQKAAKALLGAVKGAFQAIARIVTTVARKLAPVVRSAFAAIKTVVTTYLRAVSAVVKAVWSTIKVVFQTAVAIVKAVVSGNFRAIPGIIRNALGQLAGIARTLFGGMVSAIRSFVGQAGSAARSVGRAAITALSGMASEMLGVGEDLIRGLVQGIENMAGEAVDAAKGVVGGAIKGAKNLLGIGSPSKVFRKIGQDTIQGFVNGITGSESKVRATFARLKAFVDKALAGDAEQAMEKRIRRSMAAWDRWVTKREKLARKLERAETKLRDLQKQAADYSRDIAQSARDFASILTLAVEEGQVPSAQDFIRNMTERVNALAIFRSQIAQLRAQGLNEQTLRELLAAGPEAAGAAADALMRGGADAVRQVNDLQKRLGQSAAGLGDEAAKDFYGAGIAAAKGLVKGLESQQKALERTMDKLAKAMAKRLQKALAAALRNAETSKGGGGGGRRSVVSSAAPATAPSVLGMGLGRGAAPAAAAGPTIIVNGAMDPEAVARQIRRIMLGHDRRVGLRTA